MLWRDVVKDFAQRLGLSVRPESCRSNLAGVRIRRLSKKIKNRCAALWDF